jgi:Kef-type K+ transport system membrane component KefB
MTTVFIGLCVAITALPVSIRILMDLGKINSEVGQKIISIAIFDDVLALSILGVLLNLKGTDLSLVTIFRAGSWSLLKLLIFIALLSAAYVLSRYFLRKGNYIQESLDKLVSLSKGKESLFAVFFVFVLLFATVTENLGLHFIVGAFFAAMLISNSLIGTENVKAIEKSTSNISMGFLAPIFFASIGLEFNVSSIANLGLLAAVLVVSYASKIFGGFLGSRIAGYSSRFSLTLGIGLNARGIMELVIANIAYRNELISTEVFSILVIMGIVTTLTTPVLLKRAFSRLDRVAPAPVGAN